MALNILQISNRVPFPLNEGGTIGIFNYTKGFSQAGCDVTLLALDAKKHGTDLVLAIKEISTHAVVSIFPINTDLKLHSAFLSLFSNRSYNVDRFYLRKFEDAIKKQLLQNEYDVIQVEGTYPALYTDVVLLYRGRAKVVLRQHNVEYQIWKRLANNARNPIKRWYFNLLSKRLKRFERNHLNQYDAVVPVTNDDGELFKQLGCKSPIFPSPAGIDIDLWKPTFEKENPNYIYHIGSLEWMPNVEALMWFMNEVWPLVVSEAPHLEFYVAGKGMSQSLKNLKTPNVHMMGEVDVATTFIQDKSISVVPLKSGSGIRLKILEAMSAGKAVVSTTVGAQGINYVGDQDLKIADSPEGFAQAIVDLSTNPDKALDMKKLARKRIVEEYSNDSVIQKLLSFYEKL
jgi:glycosyltransferase involved in cell wall biosynthesis